VTKTSCKGAAHLPITVHIADVTTTATGKITIERAIYKSSAVAEIGDRLTTTDMGRNVGAAVSLTMGELVPIYHNVAWAEAYLRTTTDMGRKVGVCCAPFYGRRWVPI